MMSQRVERTWIHTGGYGRFRGEWVNYTYTITHHLSLSVIFKTNPNYVNQKFGGHLIEVTIIGKLSSEWPNVLKVTTAP